MVSLGLFFGFLLREIGVFLNFVVDFSEEFFNGIDLALFEAFIPLAELFLVEVSALLLQVFHIFINMNSVDSVSVDSGVVVVLIAFFFGFLKAGEPFLAVGNVKTSVDGSFHGSENFSTGCGSEET